MMDIYRKPKKTDQNHTEKGYKLLQKLVKDHPEIETSLWVGVCMSAVAHSFMESGFSHERFKKEMENCIEHYEKRWE